MVCGHLADIPQQTQHIEYRWGNVGPLSLTLAQRYTNTNLSKINKACARQN